MPALNAPAYDKNDGHHTDQHAWEALVPRLKDLRTELHKVIIGQDDIVMQLLTVMLAHGHALIIGVPGLAKTLLVRTLAQALGWDFKRIQFTPDLMPSDVTGAEILQTDRSTGERRLTFVKGPIFANLILADEINRTPPKTQAALLEAMQEYRVTVGGVRYPLERPLFVLATENPIEQEGTYQLPEAQLDRFMFNVDIDYPDAGDERRILAETTTSADRTATHVTTGAELEAARMLVRELPAAANVIDYALRLIRATRPADSTAPPSVSAMIDGVVRLPSELGITTGSPPSMTATTLFVVPKSIPTVLANLSTSTYIRLPCVNSFQTG
jgi:MoxR-like ATPase